MPLNVTITQGFGTNEHVMSLLNTNTEALLKMMVDGTAQAGAGPRKGTVTVLDTDFPGMQIEVTGAGLTYDGSGRLVSGTIAGIKVLDSAGAVIGGINAVGGLGLDVAGVKLGHQTSVANLIPLFDDWKITFSAASIAAGQAFFNSGAYFEGGFLNDSVQGSGFNDYLGGARGDDTLRGGAGMDTLDGDDTRDLSGDDGPGRDVLYGDAGVDLLRGRGGADLLYGGADGDVLTGDQIGETGNDKLYGGDGNDTLWGGAGDDTVDGGAGYDILVQPFRQSGDFTYVVNLAKGFMTGEGRDKLISIEGVTGADVQRNNLIGNKAANGFTGGSQADTLNGGGGNDRLAGLVGADLLIGGDGADTLRGGDGVDVLRGGAGADHFVFTEAGATNADTIVDFTAADQIDLYQALIGFAPAGALAAGAFKLTGSALDADDRVIYDKAKGEVWVDGDGSGAQVAQLLCKVGKGTVLSAADFGVVDFSAFTL